MYSQDINISIVVPVYNAEDYLHRCISSIIAQRFTFWELILINDGSSDSSLEICNTFARADSRITVLTQDNSGPSAARNLGLSRVNHKYITFVDSDDWVHNDYLSSLLIPVLENDTVDLVCCDYVEYSKFNSAGCKIHHLPEHIRNTAISNFEFATHLFSGVSGVLWGKLFRQSIISEHNIKLDQRISLSEDILFVMEYLIRSKKVFSVEKHLYNYNRLNENNLSGHFKMKHLKDLGLTNKVIEKLAPSLHLNAVEITKNRTLSLYKKISYDILLATNRTMIERKEDLKKISAVTRNFKSIQVNGFKDKVHFFLLQKKLFNADIFFLKSYTFLRDVMNRLK